MLKKLQNLPELHKKIIVFTIVIILGIIMLIFWFDSAAKKIENMKSANLPFLNLPSLDITKNK